MNDCLLCQHHEHYYEPFLGGGALLYILGRPPETRKNLLDLISEYGNSLTRAQGEKELQRAIEARAVVECDVAQKAFKTIATAHWADTVAKARGDLEAQLDLLDIAQMAKATDLWASALSAMH